MKVDVPTLLIKTILLRPYVFLFLALALFSASRLVSWRRTGLLFGITWVTAFLCEFSSTRIGFPFGAYFYTGVTVGRELYLSNVPFMDSLSFTFLLYASYCLALFFLLPSRGDGPPCRQCLEFGQGARTSWPVLWLSALFFTLIDVVIDPVALRGDRWFLGQIYGYPEPGVYFGVPVANFIGWGIVGLIALSGYFALERRLSPRAVGAGDGTEWARAGDVLLGCSLYYGVLVFNLAITFWIGESLLGMTGVLIFLPITALFLLRLLGRWPPARSRRSPPDMQPVL